MEFWILAVLQVVLFLHQSATGTSHAQPEPSDLPIKLADNHLFIATDISDLFFAESYYRIRIIFDQTHWQKHFDPLGDLNISYTEGNIAEISADDDVEVKRAKEEYTQLIEGWATERFKLSYDTVRDYCWLGELSRFHIRPKYLLERLKALEPNMERKNLEFTFPSKDEGSLDQYYFQNLTECKIEPKTIHITLKVPVKRQGFKFTMKNVVRIRFGIGNNNVCYLGDDGDVKFILTRNAERFGMTSRLEYNCDPDSVMNEGFVLKARKDLCFIPKTSKSNLSPCLETILDKKPAVHVKKNCNFLCTHNDSHARKQTYVSTAGESMYITSSDPEEDVSISCKNGSHAFSQVVRPPIYGALEISPYCKCEVEVGMIKMLNPETCSQELLQQDIQVLHVLPTMAVDANSNVSMDSQLFRNATRQPVADKKRTESEAPHSFVAWITTAYDRYFYQGASDFQRM